ncbi:Hypothetical_protein [Hexamita inflata]|uniref:Hypothetical_protein n=1 Tax=Hexamita inflata TaxID=28002 RepID=A0AA86USS5_9EUKA|nr:Hypothetical protein HINF_LOCUS57915 [Hexamita inflata]
MRGEELQDFYFQKKFKVEQINSGELDGKKIQSINFFVFLTNTSSLRTLQVVISLSASLIELNRKLVKFSKCLKMTVSNIMINTIVGWVYLVKLQLWEVELLFLVYYVSNYILKYFATSNADDKFQQIISSWRLFMNYSLTQEGQKYDFDRIRPQSTIQSRYLIFQKGKIEITTCNKRTAMTKINAVEDVQGRSTNSLNKLRQF